MLGDGSCGKCRFLVATCCCFLSVLLSSRSPTRWFRLEQYVLGRSIISLVAKCLDLEVNYNNLTHVSVGELFLSKVEMWAISLSYIHSIVQEDKNSKRYINKCNSLLDKNKTFKDILFRVFLPYTVQTDVLFLVSDPD